MRYARLLLVLCLLGAVAGSATRPLAADSSIEIGVAVPDAERRAQFASWWQRFAAARPELARARRDLRRQHRNWSTGRPSGLCDRARGAVLGFDGDALVAGGDYLALREVAGAVEQLGRAAWACRERRYFELDYRLGLAEEALARLDAMRRRRLGL